MEYKEPGLLGPGSLICRCDQLRLRLDDFFFGTFLPLRRASESPMAIACLRLFTFFPLRPLLSVPFLRLRIARLTSLDALFEYFRAMDHLCNEMMVA